MSKGLREKLEKLVSSHFTRITHHEAVDILLKADKKWEFTPSYEDDIAKEHENILRSILMVQYLLLIGLRILRLGI